MALGLLRLVNMKTREILKVEKANGLVFEKALIPVGNSCRLEYRVNGKRVSGFVYNLKLTEAIARDLQVTAELSK